MTKKKTSAPGKTSDPVSKNTVAKNTVTAVEPRTPPRFNSGITSRRFSFLANANWMKRASVSWRLRKGRRRIYRTRRRSYAQVCERRTNGLQVKLSTAEDHFNYGVERLNARDVDLAKHHLGCALALQPDADHVLYTLALCCGFAGDGNGACENLKRAIDLDPRNRILARQDPEFTALAGQFPGLRALLVAEPAGSY